MTGYIVYLLTSGALYFIGISLILLSLPFSFSKSTYVRSGQRLLFIFGMLSFLVSTPTIPFSMTVVVISIFLISFSILSLQFFAEYRLLKYSAILCSLVSCGFLVAIEVPYSDMSLIKLEYDEIYLLGDSLSAGIGQKDVITWPNRVNKANKLHIIDLSIGGSRVKDGMTMVPKIQNKNLPILIELGGNDWRLGKSDSINEYRLGLEQVLSSLCDGKRTVMMFEIPFPPLEYQFLKTQRELTRKYNVKLIPKRFLSDVLFLDPNATVDGLHLSNSGHERFASKLISILSINSKNSEQTF